MASDTSWSEKARRGAEEVMRGRVRGLRAAAEDCRRASCAAMVRFHALEAEAYGLLGDGLAVELNAALAACYRDEPGAQERKDRAFAAFMAARGTGVRS